MKRTLCDSPKNNPASNILDLIQSKLVTCKLCVNTCKNGFDPSYISNPPQPKPVKKNLSHTAKNAKKPIFYYFSC